MSVDAHALPLPLWIVIFLLAGAVMVRFAGSLARAGDALASGSKAGGFLVGAVLMAAATSLPELATNVSAAVDDAPQLAVGDLFGSSMANMAILAVVDLASRRRRLPGVSLAHARTATVAIGLTAIALMGMLTPSKIEIGWVGGETILIGAAYVLTLAWMNRGHKSSRPGETVGLAVPTSSSRQALRPAVITFGLAAAVILLSAPAVAISAASMAELTGIGSTFLGVTLVAATTSLPELSSSLAAVRIGAFEVAAGNLLGSNTFNMAMLLPVDIAYTKGPLLKAVDVPALVVAGVASILLMALALAALVQGEERRIGRLEPDSVVLGVAYLACLVAIWIASGGVAGGA